MKNDKDKKQKVIELLILCVICCIPFFGVCGCSIAKEDTCETCEDSEIDSEENDEKESSKEDIDKENKVIVKEESSNEEVNEIDKDIVHTEEVAQEEENVTAQLVGTWKGTWDITNGLQDILSSQYEGIKDIEFGTLECIINFDFSENTVTISTDDEASEKLEEDFKVITEKYLYSQLTEFAEAEGVTVDELLAAEGYEYETFVEELFIATDIDSVSEAYTLEEETVTYSINGNQIVFGDERSCSYELDGDLLILELEMDGEIMRIECKRQ